MNRRMKFGGCELCQRQCPLTFHHLIPRKLHKRRRFIKRYTREQLNAGLMLCRLCHNGLHRLYSEMELGSRLNSRQTLMGNAAVAKHVAWVAKQKIHSTGQEN